MSIDGLMLEADDLPPPGNTAPAKGTQTFLTVAGERFHCTCGCKLFTSCGDHHYACNSCGAKYVGEMTET